MQKSKGFTLIEVLIATVVISLGIIVSYVAVQQIFAYSSATTYRLAAAYIAKEGIEVVRNIRDTGWIQDLSWNNNGLNTGYYQASYSGYSLTSCSGCSGSVNDYNYLSSYIYSGGENSVYKRRIRIQRPTANSIKATVDVMWKERGQTKTLTVEGDLYDWR